MPALNVLIVDDSAVMRKILERSLRQTQIAIATVTEASDGVDALQQLAADPAIQVVFSDLSMPKMDGLEFLRRIKSTDRLKSLPVVIVTSEGTESKVMQAISLGAAGYIRKPFTPLQIQEALYKLFP
ncbi:MAG TPA: response regulator [Bryobacterales bacterium]|nr:response regulator [Bryobacterales bacterium]